MKKFILPILALSMSLNSAKAQSFYAKAGVGCAFSTAGQTMLPGGDPINGSITYGSSSASFDYKSTSLGAGFYGTIGIGMLFSRHVGVELNGQFGLAMRKTTGTTTEQGSSGTEAYQDHYYAKTPIFLNPSIVLQTGNNVNIYTRMGLLLPVGVKVIDEFSGTSNSGTYTGELEYKTKFTLGFAAATGISFKVGSNINIWAEANLNSFSAYIKEGQLTKYAEDGVSLISLIPDEEKTIKYDNEGSGEDINPIFSVPFSSIGIMAGVSFEF